MKRRCRSWKSLIPLVLAVILLGISVNTGILPVLADPAEENAQNAFAQEIPAALLLRRKYRPRFPKRSKEKEKR